ncbi:TetR/AcrR family transcriptional regulator [Pseudoroseicyclus tamaricis]|uniref:TetR/AcrR family transcriptional regulator n=1 Tax=Pseudoroseicyclus tamaricis TaxID=2705421 RepID=A0A6B2K0T9_9RHOB|nr:TetR/AcrR family transcriptional regulator [Pseudoroseicyclus tamaricis]NDU99935.1 TetR/AcrR family transcriptional regulator [Pseudoroseicyclus tamaricis]
MPRTGMSAGELRETATDVAICRMRKVGYGKLRLTDVAAEMGLSHAALYAHFSSKSDLLDAVVRRWLAEKEATLGEVAAGPGPAEARIETWALTLHRISRERALRDPEPCQAYDFASAAARPVVTAHREALRAQLAGLLGEAGFDEDGAPLMLEALRAFQHPQLVARHIEEDREPMLRRIVSTLLAGLKAGAPVA